MYIANKIARTSRKRAISKPHPSAPPSIVEGSKSAFAKMACDAWKDGNIMGFFDSFEINRPKPIRRMSQNRPYPPPRPQSAIRIPQSPPDPRLSTFDSPNLAAGSASESMQMYEVDFPPPAIFPPGAGRLEPGSHPGKSTAGQSGPRPANPRKSGARQSSAGKSKSGKTGPRKSGSRPTAPGRPRRAKHSGSRQSESRGSRQSAARSAGQSSSRKSRLPGGNRPPESLFPVARRSRQRLRRPPASRPARHRARCESDPIASFKRLCQRA